MANAIAESILALFSGGAQGYVASKRAREAQDEEEARYQGQIRERRTERAQAGQEAATERQARASEEAASRAQRERQFGETKKLEEEKFAFEKGRTNEVDALKAHIAKIEDDAREMQLRLLGSIIELKQQQSKTPRDYYTEMRLNTVGDILKNPDIKADEKQRLITQTNQNFDNILEQIRQLENPDVAGTVLQSPSGESYTLPPFPTVPEQPYITHPDPTIEALLNKMRSRIPNLTAYRGPIGALKTAK